MTFEQALAEWLPTQRWFAGKGTPITGITILADTPLVTGDPELRHQIVGVAQGPRTDRYQLLTGKRRSVPDELLHAVIGPDGQGMTAYDGLHDASLTAVLMTAMAEVQVIGGIRFGAEPGARIDPELRSLVLTGEQSNTSLLFGEDAILKVFRRPSPGPNPDLEVPRALARMGSPHVAAPLGWIEGELDGTPTVLGILSAYLRAAVDGWSLAATSVRDLYAIAETATAAEAGGDFAGEAHRLGEATAEVHRDLAGAFGTQELPPSGMREMSGQMLDKLRSAVAAVPELGPYAVPLRDTFSGVATMDDPITVQRIHGDYHLGQVMRTQTGWLLLDFEGEPATPLAQRRARAPALRDVAGMLRSFDYAARFQLPGHEEDGRVRAAARDWSRRNQAAFCAGYGQAGGSDPVKNAPLLRAFALDKAVYEVMYEARHRPSWLQIPLGSIADLLAGDGLGPGGAAARRARRGQGGAVHTGGPPQQFNPGGGTWV
jgi:maltokinase